MTDTVGAQVCQIAAEMFQVPQGNVRLDASPNTLNNWDSIEHLNFVLALEAKFGIELSAEEIENIRSIGDAVKIVEEKLTPS